MMNRRDFLKTAATLAALGVVSKVAGAVKAPAAAAEKSGPVDLVAIRGGEPEASAPAKTDPARLPRLPRRLSLPDGRTVPGDIAPLHSDNYSDSSCGIQKMGYSSKHRPDPRRYLFLP